VAVPLDKEVPVLRVAKGVRLLEDAVLHPLAIELLRTAGI